MLAVISFLMLVISLYLANVSRKLLVLESTDPLTGLLNTRRFRADANLLLRSGAEHYLVAAINLVHFKMMNSRLGHQGADEVLRVVGKNLETFLRPDEITARAYSDHFVVLLNVHEQEDRLTQLREHLERAEYPHACQIHVNIGAYRLKPSEREISVPLDYARYAQVSANRKHGDDSAISYYDDTDFELQKREIVLAEMAPAALENGEFVVYYQLKHGLGERDRWVGCEALVRWQNSTFGFLPPSAFIELFERNGFIIQLEHYVFETICRDLRRRIEAGKEPLPVSVNLSRRHFEHDGFLEDYEAILRHYDIPRELIEFEITETLATSNEAQVHEAIEQIHRLGCQCSLDDFGVGYSSFDMLMRFHIDTVKLDGSFFRGQTKLDPSSKVIAETVIGLAHKLGMQVVAEGIETAEQRDFLAAKQCDVVQGYFYARPLPYGKCFALLDRSAAQ